MNSGKGSTILLMVIAVATLLVAVAGTTFAYFGAMNGDDGTPTIEVTSGTVSIEYETNSKIVSEGNDFEENISEKTFTVTGVITGSSNLNYDINLIVKENTYKEGSLVYTLISDNTSNNGSTALSNSNSIVIPAGASTINIGKGVFAGPTTNGSMHKYTLKISYVKGENASESDKDAKFEANINVTQKTAK